MKPIPFIILFLGTFRLSAQDQSAADVARELSNPNTALASMTLKSQYRTFTGDLPKAGDQAGYTFLFQPSLPFVLESGDKVIWRPAVPMIVDQPVFNAEKGIFRGEDGFGDIAFDLAFAPSREDNLIVAFGLITSLPTATHDLGTDQWTLGPEFLFGVTNPSYVALMFPNHQWDVAGSGDRQVNLTTLQLGYTYLPGGGISVGSSPILTYDWVSEQWTIPLQINVSQTSTVGGKPWKFSLEANYYVEQADEFGPEWMISFNITPVVKNTLASMLNDLLK